MVRRRLISAIGAATLAALAGCALRPGAGPEPAGATLAGGLQLSFEDVLAPEAYQQTGTAVAEAPGGAPGLWAVAPGLPRPERGRIERTDTGETVDVALFAGRGAAGDGIRISAAAAVLLNMEAGRAPVRVTALRREPRIAPP